MGLLLTVAGLAAAKWIAATTPPPPPVPPQVTPAVQVGWRTLAKLTLPREVLVHGNLGPKRSATLALPLGGELKWVWPGWKLGARVAEGQALVILDSKSAEAELQRLDAVLLESKARVAEAKEAFSAAVILEGLAVEARDLAQAEEQRWDQLAEKGQDVPTVHDLARSRTVAARTNWRQAQLAIRSSELSIEVAQAAEAQALAGIISARVYLEKHALQAPFTGVLGAEAPALGAWIAPGQPVTELVDDGALRMWAFVSEGEAAEVVLGAGVQVRAAVLGPGTVAGRVVGRSPQADAGTRNVGLEIELSGGGAGGLVSGFASATLELPPFEDALIVRRSELIWEQGTPLALVVESAEDGALVAAARELVLGRTSAGSLEILGGLEVGERLIVAPLAALSPGSLVLLGDEQVGTKSPTPSSLPGGN